ncbi:MAG: hypothetical protein Q7R35_06235 [Elusimicrobiota bacterium]|nr:hypothetical protein [Elusimicrobiota bacterium]
MKLKMSIKDRIHFWIGDIQTALYRLMLRPLGLMNWFFRGMPILNSQAGTSMSPDGCYLISCSWKGLIYLIEMGFIGPPVVTSFVVHPKPWGAHFSKDMQRIIITHGLGRTILSASPTEGFSRRKFPIVQEWVSGSYPPRNIIDFISRTSSAYWKYESDPKAKSGWKSPNPFPLPPQTELDCNWEHWVSHGERFLDIPHDTCEADG